MPAAKTPGCGLLIAALHNKHFGILGHIIVKVGTEFHIEAYRFVTPNMFGSPVPPFPAVRIADLLSITAKQLHQVGRAAVSRIDYLAFAMALGLQTNAMQDHISSEPF